LLDLAPGTVEPVRRRVLKDQLGERIGRELGLADETNAPSATARRARKRAAPA
jgi:hypothetical protein